MKRGFATLILAATASAAFAQDPGAAREAGDYARYELREVTSTKKVDPEVMAKITAGLKLKLDDTLERWNRGIAPPGRGGTLAIEVVVTDLKYASASKRFWSGGFAGDSHAAGYARLIDVESGRELHRQRFWEEANSRMGALTPAAIDDAMLARFTESIGNWVISRRERNDTLKSDLSGRAATN